MKGIIPTGGRGTRMQPLTFSVNKHFIPIANKPLIFYPIETLVDAGIKEIAMTYNPGYLDAVKSLVGDGSKWGIKITYVLQEKPIGLANIIQVCEDYMKGQPFVFHLGDNIFADGIKEIVNTFTTKKTNATLTIFHHPDNRRMGVPYFDKKGNFVEFVEKPENPPNDLAVPGLYFFDNTVFKCFKGKSAIKPSARGELEISAPFNWLVANGYKVDTVEYKGKWLDPGKFDDWMEANEYILDTRLKSTIESKVSSDTKIWGRVAIGQNCEVINSQIRGPVIIGDGVYIKDSYIGPYTSIGDNSVVDDSHVENSVLMQGVKITNIKQPIDSSLIGTESTVTKNSGPTSKLKFFVGDKCQIEL